MTKKTRTIIFLISIFLFILIAPSAVFYSQGYRLDFKQKKVVQTGGFYFRALPNRANIYINGKLIKNTSLITNAAYIENLLPKNYDVEIAKDGYRSWKKTLEIKEKEVTKAENISLFPESPQFAVIDKPMPKIASFATSSDKKKILEYNNYEIEIKFSEKEEKIFLTRFSEKIGDIFWLNDYYLIFNVGDKIKIGEIDARDGLNIVDLAEFKKPSIVWDNASKKLYILSENKTYSLENLLP